MRPLSTISRSVAVLVSLLFSTCLVSLAYAQKPPVEIDVDIVVPAATCTPLPEHLIGWWPGENSARNNLIYPGTNAKTVGVTYVPAKVENGFKFNGSAYVILTEPLKLGYSSVADAQEPHAFGADMWTRFDSIEGQQTLMMNATYDPASDASAGFKLHKTADNYIQLCHGVEVRSGDPELGVAIDNGIICTKLKEEYKVAPGKWYFISFGAAIGKAGSFADFDSENPRVSQLYLKVVPEGNRWVSDPETKSYQDYDYFKAKNDGLTYEKSVIPRDAFRVALAVDAGEDIDVGSNNDRTRNEFFRGVIDEIELFDFGSDHPLDFSFDLFSGTLDGIFQKIFEAGSAGKCTGPKPVIYEKEFPDTLTGVFFEHRIRLFGNGNDYLFRLVSGTLPAGVTLSPHGTLSGVADIPVSELPKKVTFTVQASELSGGRIARLTERILAFFGISFARAADQTPPKQLEILFTPQVCAPVPSKLFAWWTGNYANNEVKNPPAGYLAELKLVPGEDDNGRFSMEQGILPELFRGDARARTDSDMVQYETYANGRRNEFFDFEGFGDHLTVAAAPYLESTAVEAWIYPKSHTAPKVHYYIPGTVIPLPQALHPQNPRIFTFNALANNRHPEREIALELTDKGLVLAGKLLIKKEDIPLNRWSYVEMRLVNNLSGKDVWTVTFNDKLAAIHEPKFGSDEGLGDPAIESLFGRKVSLGMIGGPTYWGRIDEVEYFFDAPNLSELRAVQEAGIEIGKCRSKPEIKKGALPVTQQFVYASDAPFEVSDGGLYVYEAIPSTPVPGMNLDDQTGALSGTPSRVGAFSFEVVATEAIEAKEPLVRRFLPFARLLQKLGIDEARAAGEKKQKVKKPGGNVVKSKVTRHVVPTRSVDVNITSEAGNQGVPTPGNMVAWLAHKETPTNNREIEDITKYGYHAKIQGGSLGFASVGKVGKALDFDDKAFLVYPKHIQSAPDVNLESSLGIDAWMRIKPDSCPPETPCEMMILGKGDPKGGGGGFAIYKTKENTIEACFDLRDGYGCFASRTAISSDNWYHLALSIKESSTAGKIDAAFYLNKESINKDLFGPVRRFEIRKKENGKESVVSVQEGATASFELGLTEDPLVIGKGYKGYLDEIEFFNSLSSIDALPGTVAKSIWGADSRGKNPDNVAIDADEFPDEDGTSDDGDDTSSLIDLPATTQGKLTWYQLRTRGGIAPYTFSLVRPVSGVTISKEGVLSVNPTFVGSLQIPVQVSDASISSSIVQASNLPKFWSKLLAVFGNDPAYAAGFAAPESTQVLVTLQVKRKDEQNACAVPNENLLVWLRGENHSGVPAFSDWVEHYNSLSPEVQTYGYAPAKGQSEPEIVARDAQGGYLNGHAFAFSKNQSLVIVHGTSTPGDYQIATSTGGHRFLPNLSVPFGIDAWVAFSDIRGTTTLFHAMPPGGRGEGWRVYKSSSYAGNYLHFCRSADGVTEYCLVNKEPVVPNSWYHVAATIEGSAFAPQYSFYVNGKDVPTIERMRGGLKVAFAPETSAPRFNRSDIIIGNNGAQPTVDPATSFGKTVDQEQFVGLMDEIELFRPAQPFATRVLPHVDAAAIATAAGVGKCEGIAIANTVLEDATVAEQYNVTFAALRAKGSLSWRIVKNPQTPTWIQIDEKTGILGGTPHASGDFLVTVAVADQIGARAERTYALTVNPARPPAAVVVEDTSACVVYKDRVLRPDEVESVVSRRSALIIAPNACRVDDTYEHSCVTYCGNPGVYVGARLSNGELLAPGGILYVDATAGTSRYILHDGKYLPYLIGRVLNMKNGKPLDTKVEQRLPTGESGGSTP